MNIDEIEANLNKYSVEPKKVLAELLIMTIQNQATLEALIQMMVMQMFPKDTSEDRAKIIEEIGEDVNGRAADILSAIFSKSSKKG